MITKKLLQKEINELLSKPLPWGPMMVQRVQIALKQSIVVMDALIEINKKLDNKVKYYEGNRSDVKLSRNLTMLHMRETGVSVSEIARQHNISKQRANEIIRRAKRYVESQYDTARITGLSTESNISVEGKAVAGTQENNPPSPHGRW